MKSLQGLWTLFFQSNLQTTGSGVAVFVNDRVLGGDDVYYYNGNVSIQGNKVELTVRIVRFNKMGHSIFGDLDSYHLKVAGEIHKSNMEFHGNMVEQPNMKITIRLNKIIGI